MSHTRRDLRQIVRQRVTLGGADLQGQYAFFPL